MSYFYNCLQFREIVSWVDLGRDGISPIYLAIYSATQALGWPPLKVSTEGSLQKDSWAAHLERQEGLRRQHPPPPLGVWLPSSHHWVCAQVCATQPVGQASSSCPADGETEALRGKGMCPLSPKWLRLEPDIIPGSLALNFVMQHFYSN